MVNTRFLILVVSCLGLVVGSVCADSSVKKVKSSLSEATVFFNGAELTHKASVAVAKGTNEVWITELSPHIDINSLKIKTSKGVVVASHEYSLDYTSIKTIAPAEKMLKDSVKYYGRRIKEYEVNKKTNADLLELLDKNKAIGGSQTGLSVDELSKMVEFYRKESNKLHIAQSDLDESIRVAQESLERLELQLAQEEAKNAKTTGVLKLSLTSPLATSADFTVSYFTNQANWIPAYDMNISGANGQMHILSKAKVAQTTGLDWEKVKLALSTATPSANKEAPLFNAWFLDFSYNAMLGSSMAKRSAPLAQNVYAYEDASSPKLDEAVVVKGFSSSQRQPLYLINGLTVSETDYRNLDPSMILSVEKLEGAQATALYGSRAINGVVVVRTKTLDDYVDRTEGELNAIYSIDLPYTILGNGKVQNIELKTNTVKAEIKHYAVPKLEQEVFVLAEIADWQKLGLLSGKASVTYDDTYVGETVINATSVAEKLTLTLGTDQRVSLKREKLQDLSSRKFLGKDTQQEFVYKITVKNNQTRPIKMVLKDQYPLTNQKEIQVERLDETTEATHVNEEVGVLNWEFELGAGQIKEVKNAYRVKYPKDKSINL